MSKSHEMYIIFLEFKCMWNYGFLIPENTKTTKVKFFLLVFKQMTLFAGGGFD